MKTTIKDRVDRIKDYANNAMANMPKPEAPKPQKKKEPQIEIPKELPKPPKKEKSQPISKTEVNVQKPQPAQPKPVSNTSIEEVRKASEVAAESQQVEEKSKDQELSQAIMRRDGAQKTLASLKAQLKYAGGEQKIALEERIKKKEAQLGEALEIIEKLQNS